MKHPPTLLFGLLLGLVSCSTSNYHFAARDGLPPDVKILEQARQQVGVAKGGKHKGLGDVSWFPLIAMNGELYNVAAPEMASGTGYAEFDAYGPLFMFVDGESFHYDEQQRLYERKQGSRYLWGLVNSERNEVRVPSGWRVAAETSILFGLLRWPSEEYVSTLALDRLTPVVGLVPDRAGDDAGGGEPDSDDQQF